MAAFEALDIAVAGERLQIEISIGIVTRESNVLEFSLLMRLADVALYQAKAHGRNQVAFA
jgi:hemerythrin